MTRKDPDRLTHGRKRKLKARFQAYDAAKNVRMIVATLIALFVPPTLCAALEAIGVEEIPNWFFIGSYAVAFFSWFMYVRSMIGRLVREHGLLCEECGKPLDRWRWPMRRRASHPDWRADGDLPSRCPYCRSRAELALRSTKNRREKSPIPAGRNKLHSR